MGLFDIPDPMSWYQEAKNGSLERAEEDAFVSGFYSGLLSFLWRFGVKNWLGLGPALQDAATALYLTLSEKESKNFLTLTVPKDMLNADNLSHFQTEWVSK